MRDAVWVVQSLDVHARAHVLAIAFTSYALGVLAVTGNCSIWLLGALIAAALACPVSRRIIAIALACVTAGAIAGHLAVLARARSDLGAVDGHHVTCVVETVERPHPSANGVSVRARIVDVASAGRDEVRLLRDRVALLELPADAGAGTDLAGERLRVRARIDAPAGVRNEDEPASAISSRIKAFRSF